MRMASSPFAACVAFAVGVGTLTLSRDLRAETGDAVYLSNDAALMAGAITSSVRDIGAVWYNPAGLGGGVKTQLSLSGMVYGIRFRSVPGALRTNLPGGQRPVNLSSSDIFSAPHVTAYARRITDDLSVGFGIYVTERDTRSSSHTDRTFVRRGVGGLPYDANVRQHLDASEDHAKYQLGPAFGLRMSPTFRFGASVFGTYAKTTGVSAYEVDISQVGVPGVGTFVLSQGNATVTEAGLVANLGLQWDVAPTWHLGLTVRSPELRVYQNAEGTSVSAAGDAMPGSTPRATLDVVPASGVGTAGVRAPARIVVGVNHEFARGITLSVESDLQPKTRSTATQLSTRTVVNVRAGVRIPLGETLVLGAGAFTDRDQRTLGEGFTNERIDRYGATLGCTLLTPFALSSGVKDKLVLATTIAFRYAAGIGEVRGLDLDLVGGQSQTRIVDVVYHEVLPYIGSAVSF